MEIVIGVLIGGTIVFLIGLAVWKNATKGFK